MKKKQSNIEFVVAIVAFFAGVAILTEGYYAPTADSRAAAKAKAEEIYGDRLIDEAAAEFVEEKSEPTWAPPGLPVVNGIQILPIEGAQLEEGQTREERDQVIQSWVWHLGRELTTDLMLDMSINGEISDGVYHYDLLARINSLTPEEHKRQEFLRSPEGAKWIRDWSAGLDSPDYLMGFESDLDARIGL